MRFLFSTLRFCLFIALVLQAESLFSQCNLNYPATITVCPGQNFTVNPIGVSGYNSFTWSGLNIASGGALQNPVINTTVAGTLTVTATGPSCPLQTIPIAVSLHNVIQPNINVSTTQPFCSGLNLAASVTNPQANTTYSWTLPGGGTATGVSINAPATAPAGNGTVSGTLSVTALNTVTGCSSTTTQSVSIRQAPDANFIDAYNSPSFALCLNASQFDFILTNNSSTASTNINYSVDWGNGTSNYSGVAWPYLGEVTRNYSGLGNFPLVVNVTGGNGCLSSWTQTLFNGSNPASGIANPGGTQNLCAPVTIQFPLASTVFNNTPGTIYKFWVNDNTDTTTVVHPDLPGVLQQFYTHVFNSSICNGAGSSTSFSLYMLAINGCDLNPLPSITPNITIFSKPEADFTIPEQSCVGTPVTLTNTSTGGFFQSGNNCLAPYLKWEVLLPSADYSVTSGTLGNGFPPPTTVTTGSNSIGLSFDNPGIHQVRLIARQGAACGNDTIVKSICIQNPAQSIVSALPLSGCSPLAVNTTNTSTGNAICGTLSHNWTVSPASGWSFTNGTNAQSAQPRFSFINAGTYTLTHTVSNGCGPNTSTITVTVVSPPTVSINPLTANCAPTSVSPTATVNAGGSTSVTYSWQFPNGTPASSTSLIPGSIAYANSGNSTISLTVQNECGQQTATLPLVIPAPPAQPQISPVAPICVGQSVNLQVTNVQAGLTYLWSGPNGYSNTGATVQLNSIQLNQAGNYTVTASAGNCVSQPAQVFVQVNSAPVISVSPSSPFICPGSSVLLTASGADAYTWTPSAGLSTTNQANVTASPVSATTYTVTGTVNGNPCPATTSVTVNIHTLQPITTSTVDICNQPTATQITGFSPAGGVFSTSGNITLTSSGLVTPIAAGTFAATYSFTDGNGCLSSSNFNIVVADPPTLPQLSSNSPVCVGQTADLQVTNVQSGLTYQWSGPNSYSAIGSTVQLSNVQLNQAGTYTVTASAGNCTSAPAQIVIQVDVAPILSVTPSNPSICPGASVTLTASGADTYVWSPATGLSNTTSAITNASPQSATTYTLTGLTNGISCPGTATVTVDVFTPQTLTTTTVNICNQPIATQITGFSPAGGVFSTSENITLTASGVVTPIAAGTFVATYTFTDANGCSTSENFNIVVQNAGNPNVGPNLEICQNSPVLLLSPSTGTWSGSTQVSSDGNFQTDVVGTFNLTYSEGQGSCLVTVNKTITVNPLPDINVIQPTGICTGQIGETLTGSSIAADQFEWFESANSISTANQVYVTPSVTTNYTLVASISATGCSSQQTVSVNVSPTPQAVFSIASVFCSSSIIQPTNQSQPSNAAFSWSLVSSTTTTFSEFEPVFTGLTNGTYQVQLIATVGSCSDTSTIEQFEVFEPPFVTVSNGSYSICSGNNVPVSANVIGTESTYTYSWQFGDFLSSTLLNPGAINFPNPVLNDTTISYSITVSGALCPPVTTSGSVPIAVTPSISFLIPEANGCSPFQTSAPILVYGQPTTVSLQTDNGFVTNDLSYIFNFTANTTPQTHFIYASASNGCGTVTDTMAVNVLPNPVVPLVVSSLPLQGICSGTFAQFASVSTGSADSLLVNLWYVDGALISAGTPSFSYQFTTPGNYQVALNVSDGCSDSTLVIPVQVQSQPSAAFTLNPSILCTNQTITLAASSPSADLIQWNTGDGQSYYTSSASFSYSQPGNYTISLFVSNANGVCTDSASAQVQVFPSPSVSVQANVLGTCVNDWVHFTSQITGATNFNWDFGNSANSVFANDSSYYTIPGNYTATLTVFNLAGCSAVDAVSFDIFPKPESIPFFNAQLFGPLCNAPANAQLSNLSQGAFAYQWYLDNTFVSNLFEPLISINSFGSHTIQLVAATDLGCLDTASILLNVYEKPTLALTISPLEGCQILNTTIDPSCTNCAFIKIQTGGEILSESFSDFEAQWVLPGIFDVQLSGVTANGCRDTISQAIQVFEKPSSVFNVSPGVLEDVSQEFDISNFSQPENGLTYRFFVNDQLVEYFCPDSYTINILENPIDSLVFSLVTVTDKGCSDTSDVVIPINTKGSIYIPNAFSPNDDGINEIFKPLGFNYRDVVFKIYNRWGEEIYYENNYKIENLEGWNGKIEDNTAMNATYVYTLFAKDINGKEFKKTGEVILVR